MYTLHYGIHIHTGHNPGMGSENEKKKNIFQAVKQKEDL